MRELEQAGVDIPRLFHGPTNFGPCVFGLVFLFSLCSVRSYRSARSRYTHLTWLLLHFSPWAMSRCRANPKSVRSASTVLYEREVYKRGVCLEPFSRLESS